jgi:hypothetical protein
MLVDDTGRHMFLLSDTEIFYNNWDSDVITKIDIQAHSTSMDGMSGEQ